MDQNVPPKGNILIVDDNPNNLRLLSIMLTEESYKVRSVTNGPMALIAAQAALPDLILLDINMSSMDGYEVCQALKANVFTAEVPVIFVSALDEVLDKVKAFAVGGVDYITKPFHPDEVMVRVENQLTIKRLQSSLQEKNALLQQELRDRTQAEINYRSIFENAVEGIFQTTRTGEYLKANPALARIYGYDSPETLIEQLNDASKNHLYVNPNRRLEFVAAMDAYNEVTSFESEVNRKDGKKIWIAESARSVRDSQGNLLYYEGFVDDITKRKQVEEALQRSNSLLGAQKEAAIDGILATDEQGKIVSYNQRFCEMWQIPEILLTKEEPRLLTALIYRANLPTELVNVIEEAYDHPTEPRQTEIYLADQRVFDCYSGPVLSSTGAFYGMIWYFREITDRIMAQLELQAEKEKSEHLLLNILPPPIAERLKQKSDRMSEAPIADGFEDVTVLFADIVDFTELSSHISPSETVNLLNRIFSIFDNLAEQHGVEKIKTIGDAYMVVGGLIGRKGDHVEAIANMALDIQKEVSQFKAFDHNLNIRIGINTGAVVAGVIGIKKFIYDLWGDTVNVASRMESQGIPGSIQVTEVTYQRLKDKYLFEHRGAIPIKGKGEMSTYLLTGKRDM